MPWCPKCKTEYREGITICADCKTELVEEYKEVVLQNATELLVKIDAEHIGVAKKLHDFLEYSGVSSVALNEGDMIGIYVAPEDAKLAKKCFKAFHSVENEMLMQRAAEDAFLKGEEYDYFGDDDEDEEDASEEFSDAASDDSEPAAYYNNTMTVSGDSSGEKEEKRFVSANARYEDYRSSGFTFTVLGVLGIVFALLNFLEIFTLFGSTFSSIVLFIMFGIFLVLGVFSFVKASQLKEGAMKEKQTIEAAKAWMQKNFNRELLASLAPEEVNENEPNTEELIYLDRLDQLREILLKEFPELHDSLAEQLIEEYYS